MKVSDKFKSLINETFKQIESSFSSYKSEPAVAANIFSKISKGLKQSSFSIINLETLNK
jgi:hypothetical protein